MDLTLRPMSTSQILDRTFQLYRNNFMLFAGIAALPPALVLLAQIGAAALATLPGLFSGAVPSTVLFVAGIVVLVVLYLAGVSLATGATVYAVSRAHLGNPVAIRESYKAIRPMLWKVARIVISVLLRSSAAFLLAVLVIALPLGLTSALDPTWLSQTGPVVGFGLGLIFVVTFIVCIIWSIRLYCSYQLAVPVCVLEKLGAVACLRRSRFLTRGKSVQRILLINFLAAILAYVLNLAFSIPILIGMTTLTTKALALPLVLVVLQYFASFLAGTLAGPISTIATALVYYDERVRKEAFDLQLMMDALNQSAPAQPIPALPLIG